jgi:hypothetical protein
MRKKAEISETWTGQSHTIEIHLPLIIFKDSDSQVVYCPALDVSGYGKTEHEAFESFKICMDEFFQYTLNKNTFRDELQRLGWKLKKSKTKPMIPPDMSVLLCNNDNFSNIFNNFPFRKVSEAFSLPVA